MQACQEIVLVSVVIHMSLIPAQSIKLPFECQTGNGAMYRRDIHLAHGRLSAVVPELLGCKQNMSSIRDRPHRGDHLNGSKKKRLKMSAFSLAWYTLEKRAAVKQAEAAKGRTTTSHYCSVHTCIKQEEKSMWLKLLNAN